MADTPRDPPGLKEQWSDEISALLSQWGEVSLCYSWLHNYSQRKYKRKYHHMSTPIIVLSTLTGTANFADSYVPDGFKQGFSARWARGRVPTGDAPTPVQSIRSA